jgi:uroporphyrin-III C-methyltransferase
MWYLLIQESTIPRNTKLKPGKVFIVGAGPGDPGLLTLKALRAIENADVVVYDRLVNADVLNYCRVECELIFVGKEDGLHPINQESINEILIDKSRCGLDVVRLKGGNPFVFGRGFEEAVALQNAGLEYEIVPGVTSGLSAPIYSGFPITQRGLVTQCVLVTAHESPDKPETQVEWEKLAVLKNASLIIYMGASRIEAICSKLILYGMDAAMPVAVIENGTLPKQRTIRARLDEIANIFREHNFHAPTIIMVSPAIVLKEENSWFEKKVLFNKKIVVIGGSKQSRLLYERLYDLGGEIVQFPLAEIETEQCPTCAIQAIDSERVGERAESTHVISSHPSDVYDEGSASMEMRSPCGGRHEFSLMDDIRLLGADAYVFTAVAAAEKFFEVLGQETATGILQNSLSIAKDRLTERALKRMNVRNVYIQHTPDSEGTRDLIRELFLKK